MNSIVSFIKIFFFYKKIDKKWKKYIIKKANQMKTLIENNILYNKIKSQTQKKINIFHIKYTSI